jgi:hypothetical protein
LKPGHHLFLAAVLFGSAFSGRAEILLKGVSIQAETANFSLYSVEEQTSRWVSLGQSFAGVRAVSYDVSREVLTVKSGERLIELRMTPSPIRAGSAEIPKTEVPVGNVVRVSGSGVVTAGDKVIPPEALGTLAASLDKGAPVRIEMARNTKAEASLAVFNAIRDAGISRLTIATEPAP